VHLIQMAYTVPAGGADSIETDDSSTSNGSRGERSVIVNTYGRMNRLITAIRNALDTEEGASLVEYALLVGLIAIVCLVAIAFFGTSVQSSFSHTGSAVGSAGP